MPELEDERPTPRRTEAEQSKIIKEAHEKATSIVDNQGYLEPDKRRDEIIDVMNRLLPPDMYAVRNPDRDFNPEAAYISICESSDTDVDTIY